jgi:hypothetical protein
VVACGVAGRFADGVWLGQRQVLIVIDNCAPSAVA